MLKLRALRTYVINYVITHKLISDTDLLLQGFKCEKNTTGGVMLGHVYFPSNTVNINGGGYYEHKNFH